MSFEFIKKLPTPEEIRNQYPVDAEIQALKEKRDAEIRDVFTGKSDKFLAIIGPCSADNEDAVCDYLLRLRKVQEKIEDKVLIILVFTQTNLVQQVKDTREWSISQILRKNQTFLQV